MWGPQGANGESRRMSFRSYKTVNTNMCFGSYKPIKRILRAYHLVIEICSPSRTSISFGLYKRVVQVKKIVVIQTCSLGQKNIVSGSYKPSVIGTN